MVVTVLQLLLVCVLDPHLETDVDIVLRREEYLGESQSQRAFIEF